MHEDQRIGKFIPLMRSLYGAARENLGFKPHAKICIVKSGENMQNPLGKTAHYSPADHKIGLYTQGRHIKDILRSLAHELVHHAQNCRGDFEQNGETIAGYAQEDGHLREMEREAYERGNMIFRDWEDNLKDKGGKPLFTSTSQYVPGPTSDVAGTRALFEQKKMKKKLNEQEEEKKATPQKPKVAPDLPPQAVSDLKKLQSKFAGRQDRRERCVAIKNWADKHKLYKNPYAVRTYIKPCAAALGQGLTWRSSRTVDALEKWLGTPLRFGQAKQRWAENKNHNITNNSLFEGDKMNKKLKESQLRTIVREVIQEIVNEDYIGDANQDELAYGGEIEAEKSGNQNEGTAKGEFDETNPTTAAWETPDESLFEDSGESEAWNDWKNEHADDDHIKEMKHHLRALEHDRDYERKDAEYDHDDYEDDRRDESLNEDSGEEEAWNDWKNEHADDDHIKELEHHLRALKDDRDYERKGAEYDHDKYEDEGYDDKDKDKDVDEEVEVVELAETFFPKGRSVRQKARTDLNEALMKRWSKIIK